MNFFKKLFGKPEPAKGRELTHPQQLQVGDLLQIGDSFALPERLRKQQLEVNRINTIEFEFEHYPRFICQGAQAEPVYISLPGDNSNQIKFSLLLNRADVESLFDMDAFAEIFDEPGKARLTPVSESSPFTTMLAKEFVQQDFATAGYFHRQDYRNTKPPQFQEDSQGRQFEYFSLFGEQEQRWIEIFVFENGDTDIYLSLFRPVNDIAELWPKS